MSKYNVIVLRVSGQTAFQVEAVSAGDAQERALVLSESAVFAEPANRRVAGQLSQHADAEPAVTGLEIHVVPSRDVDADGRVRP